MTRILWIFSLFISGTAGLMIFNTMVLGLGDSKFPIDFETALGFYLPIWLGFYTPHMIVGLLMLTIKIPASNNRTIATTAFTVLTLSALSISFALDAKVEALAVEWIAALFIAWLFRRWLLGMTKSAEA